MRFFSAQSRLVRILFAFFFFFLIVLANVHSIHRTSVFAAGPTPTPGGPTPTLVPASTNAIWQFDPEVTEVGKNADRARQILWWALSHPGIHASPVLAQVWAFSRTIVMVLVILVIVAFGVGFIIARNRGFMGSLFSGISSPVFGITIPSVFLKIGVVLLYVTFSYVLVLGLIQTSEIIMRFFIENIGGQNLFNVFFAGSGNIEANYTTFVGYRDVNPLNQEMVHTSLLIIRITSLTYYSMALLIFLRTILLWFMLIISPFLALLMPFIFIRNVGWIWIGVFFQWLFYGPLFSIFLAGLAHIWVYGIPYAFDFSRVNKPEGQIYRTAINILYGGPAQTLSAGNSANYIDTYAEYVIALVMLWASIILPWFLLRIFRDYCCELLASANATLASIFDRMRQYPVPPPSQPTLPSSTTGVSVELPFRQRVKETIQRVQETKIEDIKEISRVTTSEIAKAMDLSVSSLADVGRLETDQLKRTQVQQRMDKLASPHQISSRVERERYSALRSELQSRALAGDKTAQSMLASIENKKEALATQVAMASVGRPAGRAVSAPGAPTPSAQKIPLIIPTTQQIANIASNPMAVQKIAQVIGVTILEVENVLQTLPTVNVSSEQLISIISQKTGLSETKVQEVIALSSTEIVSQPKIVQNIASKVNVSEDKVKEVLQAFPTVAASSSQVISAVEQKTQVSEGKIRDILTIESIAVISQPKVVQNIANKVGVTEDKIREVLQTLPTVATPASQVVNAVAQKSGLSEDKVKEIVTTVTPTSVVAPQKAVTVEDYEEVKTMWLNHYRNAPIPTSETIKTREDWLREESKKLTNVSNLLTSSNPKLKQKGLEQVSEILPFMLLGGFSDAEVSTYIKAKLTANQQIQSELMVEQKTKEAVVKEVREEEETVYVQQPTQKKAEGVAQASQAAHFDEPVGADVQEVTAATADESPTQTAQPVIVPTSSTVEIAHILNLFISSLTDVAQLDIDEGKRVQLQGTLGKLSSPETVQTPSEKSMYVTVRNELEKRMRAGDSIAQTIVHAQGDNETLATYITFQNKSYNFQTIAKDTNVPEDKIVEFFKAVSVISEQEKPVDIVHSLSQQINLPEDKVQEILIQSAKTFTIQPAAIHRISQQVEVPDEKVHDVLTVFSKTSVPPSHVVQEVSQKTGVSESNIFQILSSVSSIAAQLSLPEIAAASHATKSITIAGKIAPTQVAIEDYEEVKKMWVKHYREAPIMRSDTVNTREEWLDEDIVKLTNTSDLIASSDEIQKKKGLTQIGGMLPFLLLGGFSEIEAYTYLQAKLEAAKQAKEELGMVVKAKEEVKKENSGEKVTVDVLKAKDAKKDESSPEKSDTIIK